MVVQDFERWIAEGATWPDESVPAFHLPKNERPSIWRSARNSHWCWQPITPPSIPVAESAKKLHPIDQLIRAKLAYAGLLPSKPADKRTWLRRVTFDLTGLPPSLTEIENFIADKSDDSFRDRSRPITRISPLWRKVGKALDGFSALRRDMRT